MTKNKVIFVLGMHRSGTSAITRVINLLGAGLPDNLMPANSDNVSGYWESKNIAFINNQILQLADTSWFDNQNISEEWLLSLPLQELRDSAKQLIHDIFAGTHQQSLVIKDPRICRLLPFWHNLLDDIAIDYSHIHIVRHPEEVFASFKLRYETPEYRSAAIIHRPKLNLLWLRYVLDAEKYSRHKKRHFVNYQNLVDFPNETIKQLSEFLNDFSSELAVTESNKTQLNNFISKRHKHHKFTNNKIHPELSLSYKVYELILNINISVTTELDNVRNAFNDTLKCYHRLMARTANRIHKLTPWFQEVANMVSMQLTATNNQVKSVLYLSGSPLSKGHTYRVVYQMEALMKAGIDCSYQNMDEEFDINTIKKYQIIIVFRAEWSERLKAIYDACDKYGVIKVFDVDDLIFQPEIMTEKNWDYLRLINQQEREQWNKIFTNYTIALENSDHVIVPTHALADSVRTLGKPVDVIANGVGQEMLVCCQAVMDEKRLKPSQIDGYVRLGYASGTPTHQKDFAEIYPVICQLLKEYENLILVVVGCLNLDEFSQLLPYKNRIEKRAIVEHMDLFSEYYRFDINLAPLQKNNPFCECKSQLKYHESALVEVPTVSSTTQPYKEAIHENKTGYCADDFDSWYKNISCLINDKGKRIVMGREAKYHVIAKYSVDMQSNLAAAVVANVLEEFRLRLM